MKAQCWGIITLDGDLSAPTIRTSKCICIRDYMALKGNHGTTWRQLKRWGWNVVPVTLTFAAPKKRRAP